MGLLGLQVDFIAMLEAFEEEIRCSAESLPDRLRLVAAHRADVLPVGLQPANFGSRLVPLGGRGELFGALAQRFLARQIRRPHFFPFGQIRIAPREKAIARLAETLPRGLRLLPWHRSDLLPLDLQLFQLVGGLDPVRGVGDRFRAFDEHDLAFEVLPALLVAVHEELADARLHRVRRLTVAMPQCLGLRSRRLGDGFPAFLDVVHFAGELLEILVLGAPAFLIEAELYAQGFGLRDQLFLHGGIGKALPLIHLAQIVEARIQCRLRLSQPVGERVPFPLIGDARRDRVHAGSQIPHQPVGFA